jgi:predicted  nucleic acid-binding Zn-ribbon protein
MHCSEQDQIYHLESKVNQLLRRLNDVENELDELKNLNRIVSGIEIEITDMKGSISKLEVKTKDLDNQVYRIESAIP